MLSERARKELKKRAARYRAAGIQPTAWQVIKEIISVDPVNASMALGGIIVSIVGIVVALLIL